MRPRYTQHEGRMRLATLKDAGGGPVKAARVLDKGTFEALGARRPRIAGRRSHEVVAALVAAIGRNHRPTLFDDLARVVDAHD